MRKNFVTVWKLYVNLFPISALVAEAFLIFLLLIGKPQIDNNNQWLLPQTREAFKTKKSITLHTNNYSWTTSNIAKNHHRFSPFTTEWQCTSSHSNSYFERNTSGTMQHNSIFGWFVLSTNIGDCDNCRFDHGQQAHVIDKAIKHQSQQVLVLCH